VREAATICARPCKLTFDLLTLKMVSESRMTWATSVPILIFLSLSVLDLGLMYATDRHTSDVHNRLMPPLWWRGHNNAQVSHGNLRWTVEVKWYHTQRC